MPAMTVESKVGDEFDFFETDYILPPCKDSE
jgi:hypothetical protein